MFVFGEVHHPHYTDRHDFQELRVSMHQVSSLPMLTQNAIDIDGSQPRRMIHDTVRLVCNCLQSAVGSEVLECPPGTALPVVHLNWWGFAQPFPP
jgi:hypothetical protein